jgi:hypothetical protein
MQGRRPLQIVKRSSVSPQLVGLGGMGHPHGVLVRRGFETQMRRDVWGGPQRAKRNSNMIEMCRKLNVDSVRLQVSAKYETSVASSSPDLQNATTRSESLGRNIRGETQSHHESS